MLIKNGYLFFIYAYTRLMLVDLSVNGAIPTIQAPYFLIELL